MGGVHIGARERHVLNLIRLTTALAYSSGEEGDNFLVQMISTCHPSRKGRGGGRHPVVLTRQLDWGRRIRISVDSMMWSMKWNPNSSGSRGKRSSRSVREMAFKQWRLIKYITSRTVGNILFSKLYPEFFTKPKRAVSALFYLSWKCLPIRNYFLIKGNF